MCHKSERQQCTEHEPRRTNLDTDENTHETKPLEIPTPGFGVLLLHPSGEEMNVIYTAHVWKRVLCVLHMKKASEWAGDQVCVVRGWRVFCTRGQGFPHNTVCYHCLVSLFVLCQLCITFQSRQKEELKENTRLKQRKRRWRRNFANKDLEKKKQTEGHEGQRGPSSLISLIKNDEEEKKMKEARMRRGLVQPRHYFHLITALFSWLKEGRHTSDKEKKKRWQKEGKIKKNRVIRRSQLDFLPTVGRFIRLFICLTAKS